jgi:hypothetical protein
VRFLAGPNIVAQAVRALRAAGNDGVYLGERPADPGDLPPPRGGRVREGVSLSIVIGNRIPPYCFSTIWVMLQPNSA